MQSHITLILASSMSSIIHSSLKDVLCSKGIHSKIPSTFFWILKIVFIANIYATIPRWQKPSTSAFLFILTFTVLPKSTVTASSIKWICQCHLNVFVFILNILSRADSSIKKCGICSAFDVFHFFPILWYQISRYMVSVVIVFSLYCFPVFCWVNNALKDSLNYYLAGARCLWLHNGEWRLHRMAEL